MKSHLWLYEMSRQIFWIPGRVFKVLFSIEVESLFSNVFFLAVWWMHKYWAEYYSLFLAHLNCLDGSFSKCCRRIGMGIAEIASLWACFQVDKSPDNKGKRCAYHSWSCKMTISTSLLNCLYCKLYHIFLKLSKFQECFNSPCFSLAQTGCIYSKISH